MDLAFDAPAAAGRQGGAMPRAVAPRAALRAVSADTALLRRVRAGHLQGHVHSVFERVVNVAAGDGELFTLACRSLDDAPHTARCDLAGWRGSGVRVGDPVVACAGGLRVGDAVRLDCGDAAPWDCVLPPYPAKPRAARANLQALRQALDGHRLQLLESGGAFEQLALRTVDQRLQRLADALRGGRPQSAVVHAQALLGLGPGLTPSGDDVLLGLFVVLHLPGSPCEGWLGGGAPVLAGAAGATHAISLAALHRAAEGRVRESVVVLLRELLHGGGGAALAAALDHVLAIGSSSGADIATGLACGLQLQLSEGTPS